MYLPCCHLHRFTWDSFSSGTVPALPLLAALRTPAVACTARCHRLGTLFTHAVLCVFNAHTCAAAFARTLPHTLPCMLFAVLPLPPYTPACHCCHIWSFLLLHHMPVPALYFLQFHGFGFHARAPCRTATDNNVHCCTTTATIPQPAFSHLALRSFRAVCMRTPAPVLRTAACCAGRMHWAGFTHCCVSGSGFSVSLPAFTVDLPPRRARNRCLLPAVLPLPLRALSRTHACAPPRLAALPASFNPTQRAARFFFSGCRVLPAAAPAVRRCLTVPRTYTAQPRFCYYTPGLHCVSLPFSRHACWFCCAVHG